MEAEQQEAKRARAAAGVSGVVPQIWPSQASLYAQGLEHKAETQTDGTSWVVNGKAERAAAFTAADSDGATLQRRQAEARRALMARPIRPS